MEDNTKTAIRSLLAAYQIEAEARGIWWNPNYRDCVQAALVYYRGIRNPGLVSEVEEEGYQGDTFMIWKDKNKPDQFFYIQFGWGSCSGCDALQADEGKEELVVESLNTSIMPISQGKVREYLEKEKQNTHNLDMLKKLIEKLPEDVH